MKRARDKAAALAAGARGLDALCREYREKRATVRLEQLAGGALPFYAAAAVGRVAKNEFRKMKVLFTLF